MNVYFIKYTDYYDTDSPTVIKKILQKLPEGSKYIGQFEDEAEFHVVDSFCAKNKKDAIRFVEEDYVFPPGHEVESYEVHDKYGNLLFDDLDKGGLNMGKNEYDVTMAVDFQSDRQAGISGFYAEVHFENPFLEPFTQSDKKFMKDVIADLYDVAPRYIHEVH